MRIISQAEIKQQNNLRSIKEVAEYASVPEQTLRYHLARGYLSAPRTAQHGLRRYYTIGEADAIKAYFDQRRR